MFYRQIRATVPALEVKLQPAWPDVQHVTQADEKEKESYMYVYENRYDLKPLPDLQQGTDLVDQISSSCESGQRMRMEDHTSDRNSVTNKGHT